MHSQRKHTMQHNVSPQQEQSNAAVHMVVGVELLNFMMCSAQAQSLESLNVPTSAVHFLLMIINMMWVLFVSKVMLLLPLITDT